MQPFAFTLKLTKAEHRIFTGQPCYAVAISFLADGCEQLLPIGTIHREKMAGMGNCNMWGSRYRWAIDSTFDFDTKKRSNRTPDTHGLFTVYTDTLSDARAIIGQRLLDVLAAGLNLKSVEV